MNKVFYQNNFSCKYSEPGHICLSENSRFSLYNRKHRGGGGLQGWDSVISQASSKGLLHAAVASGKVKKWKSDTSQVHNV